MKYRILTHREEETQFGKIWIDTQENDGKQYKKNKHKNVCFRISLTERDKQFGHTAIFPKYNELQVMIESLAEIHGKEEVERELGIRILGGDKKDERNKMD